MVTFELFAKMMVRALAGASASWLHAVNAKLAAPLRVKTGLTRFLPARLQGKWNEPQVEAVKWQGSGDVAAFAKADCLLVVPPHREEFAVGETMQILLI
jgi:molybdopterin molybdotransferase